VPPVSGGVVTVTSEEVTGQGRGTFDTDPFGGATMWRFDFNAAGSANFDPYTSVGATNIYDPDAGLRLAGQRPTFSRGIANDLLRDGHWGTDNTFLVNVAPGSYVVNVTLGDASFARNFIQVDVNGAAQISNLATAAGQFVHATTETVSPVDGQLAVRVRSTGGDPYFTINALEIWKLEDRRELTVGPEGLQPVANGVAEAELTVSGVHEGTYTVGLDLGRIMNAEVGALSGLDDGDPRYAGFQVVVPAGETSFKVRVQSPTAGGEATLSIQRVDGTEAGSQTLTFILPAARRFDFNGSGNAVQDGFTGVRGNNLYYANNGYGWTQSVPEFQRGETGYSVNPANVPLYRDGHWGSAPRTFQVAVDPDATYDVRVYVGDRSFARNLIQVAVEGAPATFDGNLNSPRIIPSTTANGFVAVTVVGGQAADGVLDITIVNTGGDPYWVINGIDVWKREPDNPSLHEPGVRICSQPRGPARWSVN
jgi:hypothetical protein